MLRLLRCSPSPVPLAFNQSQRKILYLSQLTCSPPWHTDLIKDVKSVKQIQTRATNFTREKSFSKTSFQVGMDLKNVQKQGRVERTQEDYPASAKITQQMPGSLLRSFISALFLSFFSGPSLLEMKFCRNIFPSFFSFWGIF